MTSTQPGWRTRSCRHTSTPSRSGSPRSSSTRSNSVSVASRSADRPPRAQVTSCPWATSPDSSSDPIVSSSSTTSSRPIGPAYGPRCRPGGLPAAYLAARSLPGSGGSGPAGIGGDRGADVPGGDRRRARAGRDRAVPGLQPRAQRAAAGADRRALGAGPGRVRAGVAVPGVHRRAARRDRAGAAGLLPAPTGCGSSAACSPRCGTAGCPHRTSGWPGCSCWPRSRSGSAVCCWSTPSAPCSAARSRRRCS